MKGLDFGSHPDLLVGLGHPDDAGVYRLTDDIALVQTVDFFTPIVDDPFTFGQIAAANALSDVYAMGGTPLTALNVVCFPNDSMNIEVLREILKGGLQKTREADCALVGGHTVQAPELKYGLSVTGTVHPKKVLSNRGAKAGDTLVLTKRLGTGIITTAIKGSLANDNIIAEVSGAMSRLNREAVNLSADLSVHALTDITGFGLAGHAAEMISGTGLGMEIVASELPVFAEVEGFCRMGLLPGGLHRNRTHVASRLRLDKTVPPHFADIVADPQTSGGLLFALAPDEADILLERLDRSDTPGAAIGEIISDNDEIILLK